LTHRIQWRRFFRGHREGKDVRPGESSIPVPIDVWSDFDCPFCFAVMFSLDRLRQHAKVVLRWRAFQLRPLNAPPMPPTVRVRVQQEHERVANMVREQFHVELHPGPIGISTRSAHIAAKFAEEYGAGEAFHAAAMNAYWRQSQSLEDKSVLERIVSSLGLDAGSLVQRWDDPLLSAAIDADLGLASVHGIRVVPALMFAERSLVTGAQPYEVLRQALEKTRAAA
jgi:predicted DsbA family dithiol-disulfide isomerase